MDVMTSYKHRQSANIKERDFLEKSKKRWEKVRHNGVVIALQIALHKIKGKN